MTSHVTVGLRVQMHQMLETSRHMLPERFWPIGPHPTPNHSVRGVKQAAHLGRIAQVRIERTAGLIPLNGAVCGSA